MKKLPLTFYQRNNVIKIAEELVGCQVFTFLEGVLTGGRIVETEAYDGRIDRACHAFFGMTPRNETMFAEGGVAYVYICYGVHMMLNIVTNERHIGDAVLIRAIEPTEGVDFMLARRNKQTIKRLTAGPGCVAQALGVDKALDGISMCSDRLWIEPSRSEKVILETDRRVGVESVGEDAKLPWRFFESKNPFISRGHQKPL